MAEASAPVLSCTGMSAGYNGVAAVSDLDLVVHEGEVVALVGANGAGKSTTLSVLAGLAKPLSGSVSFLGSTKYEPAFRRARRGLAMVADDRSVLRTLTVEDNLRLGAGGTETAVRIFPELTPLSKRPAALLADEVSLGLAPQVTQRLHRAIRTAADEGTAVVLVEQKVRLTMKFADRIVVLRGGRKVLEGAPSEIEGDLELLEQQYLGAHSAPVDPEA
jgi:branched-chain amino acid transport system ATP-binding protein